MLAGAVAANPDYDLTAVDPYTFGYLLRASLGGTNDHRASWIDDSVPRSLTPGTAVSATVEVRNDGWDDWAAGTCNLGLLVGPAGHATPATVGTTVPSFSIASDMPPGATSNVPVTFTAPTALGAYNLSYDVECGNGWFETYENIPYNDSLAVVAAPPPQDAGTGTPDAGLTADAGTAADAGSAKDAGTTEDAGATEDAGTAEDAGSTADAGATEDAGAAEDAGTTPEDAGMAVDAGRSGDAGPETDGGEGRDGGSAPDAGAARDGGTSSDGGVAPDAGTPAPAADAGSVADAGEAQSASSPAGCGCGSAGSPSGLGLLLLSLATVRRRARRA